MTDSFSEIMKAALDEFIQEEVEMQVSQSSATNQTLKKQQLTCQSLVNIESFQKTCMHGFLGMIQRIGQDKQSPNYQAFQREIETFFKTIEHEEELISFTQQSQEGKTWREIFSFSAEFMERLFQIAAETLRAKALEEAKAYFLTLCWIDSNEFIFWKGLGCAAYHLEQYEEAAQAFIRASDLTEDHSILFNLARCLELSGHTEDAKTCYTYFIEQEKLFTSDRIALDLAQARLKNL